MSKTYEIGPRQNFIPLPTGEYEMTLKAVEEQIQDEDVKFNGKIIARKGDVKLEWTWIVELPNSEEPATRKSRTPIPASFNEKSGMVHILLALGLVDSAKAIAEGCKIDPERGIGRKCLGTIVKKLKEGKTDEWTDNITAYAPLAAAIAPAAGLAAAAGSKLKARLEALIDFAGMATSDVGWDTSTAVMAGDMKAIGAQGMTDSAVKRLEEVVELVQMATGKTPEYAMPTCLREGLIEQDRLMAMLEDPQ